MTYSHLINTRNFLLRHAHDALCAEVASAYSAASCLQGEMASYYADQDIDRLERMSPEEMLPPIFEKLELEIERREKGVKAND